MKQREGPIKATAAKSSLSSKSPSVSSTTLASPKGIERAVKVPPRTTVLFVYHLSTLLSQGVGLVPSIHVLGTQQDEPVMKTVIVDLARKLEQGQSLSKAFSAYPLIFDSTCVALARIGEQTGGLDRCLQILSDWKLQELDRSEQIRSAMIYPLAIVSLATVLMLVLFRVVLPPLLGLLIELKAPLPLATRLVMFCSALLAKPLFWIVMILLGVGCYVGLKEARGHEEGRIFIESTLRKLPPLGGLILLRSSAKFASALGLMVQCGVDYSTAVMNSAAASGSDLILDDHRRLQHLLKQGEQISVGLKGRPDLYPSMISAFLAAGEESATIPRVLNLCAKQLEQELEYRIQLAMTALEPLLLFGIGGLVTVVLISVFLPLYACLNQL